MLLACVLVGTSGCRAAHPSSPDVVLTLQPYFRDLRIVRVAAAGDTLDLLFDTGGGATVVTPEVATRHGCTPFGRDVGHRMDGERVEFARCDSLTLSAAGWDRRFAPVGVFDINALLPPILPHLDGVLALDAFVGHVISVDLPNNRVTLHRERPDAVALAALPARPATGMGGASLSVMVRVTGRRGPLWFLLDSGNLVGTRVAPWVTADSLLSLTPGGMIELRIGSRGATLPHTTADLAIDGALGTDFFQQGPVVLDLRRFAFP
jgi:hypothetical protein